MISMQTNKPDACDDDDDFHVSPIEYYRLRRRRSRSPDGGDTVRAIDDAQLSGMQSEGQTKPSSTTPTFTRRRKRVIVRQPEIMQKLPQSLVASQRDSLELRCQVYGIPKPEITWSKGRDVLKQDARTIFVNDADDNTFYGLLINNVAAEDEGEYSILAQNEAGQASSTTYVHVAPRAADQTVFVHRRQICSIPEESLTEEDEELTEGHQVSVFTQLSHERFESSSQEESTENSLISVDPSTVACAANVHMVAEQHFERMIESTCTGYQLGPTNSDVSGRTYEPPCDYSVYYSLLAIQLLCFTALVFWSQPNELFSDARQFFSWTAVLILWCLFNR